MGKLKGSRHGPKVATFAGVFPVRRQNGGAISPSGDEKTPASGTLAGVFGFPKSETITVFDEPDTPYGYSGNVRLEGGLDSGSDARRES